MLETRPSFIMGRLIEFLLIGLNAQRTLAGATKLQNEMFLSRAKSQYLVGLPSHFSTRPAAALGRLRRRLV